MNPNYAALSASDGVGEPSRATVQSPGRSIGSTAIPVDTTTNWPAGTFIATTGTLLSSGKLDPTTVQVFYGTASGTTITITSFAAGYTDKGNTAGDVVVIKPSTEWANLVSDGILGTTQFPANFQNFVESTGGVWTAGAGLVGSATAGYVWYSGTRSAMAAVASHTFTASKDTYIDYNPATAAWTYVAVTNGAAVPAVTANCVRVAQVITGASAISSVSQQAYSSPVALTWKFLGYAQITSDFTTSSSSSIVDVTNLAVTVTIPSGATAVRVKVYSRNMSASGSPTGLQCNVLIRTGSTTLQELTASVTGSNLYPVGTVTWVGQGISAGSVTYKASIQSTNATYNMTLAAAATYPAFILVECC